MLGVFYTGSGGDYSKNIKANSEVINITMDTLKHNTYELIIWNNTELENPRLLKLIFDAELVDLKRHTPSAEVEWLTV